MDQPMSPPVAPTPMANTLPGAGSLLRSSWQYYTTHLSRLLTIALFSWLIIAAATIVTTLLGIPTQKLPHLTPLFGLIMAAYVIVIVIAASWQYVALIYALTPEGETKKPLEAYKASSHWVWPYFLAAIISGVLTCLGFILLIIPGIILAVWFCFASFVIVLEGKGSIAALKASRNYVRGRFGAILSRLAVLILISIGVSIVIGLFSGLLGATAKNFVNLVLSLFLTPFIVVYGYQLFQAVRQHPQ